MRFGAYNIDDLAHMATHQHNSKDRGKGEWLLRQKNTLVTKAAIVIEWCHANLSNCTN